MNFNPFRKFFTVILAGFCVLQSCQDSPLNPIETKFELDLRTTLGKASAGQSFVNIKASEEWTLKIQPEDISWARLCEEIGAGSGSTSLTGKGSATVFLEWDENPSAVSRNLNLILQSGEKTVSAVFAQAGKGQIAEIESDPVALWMELPEITDANLYFIHHPMTIGSTKTRNYSYYYDAQNLVARWVAYPLNRTLKSGSCGRSDIWGLDPRVPRKYQPVIYSPFSGGGARGHQIPSADRQIEKYNIETYYGVNMTSQDYDFNGGIWARLEQYVRDCSESFDTLYVVTGCDVSNSSKKAYDNDGKAVTVPGGYFKALLGYKRNKTIGITQRTGGYTAIGFYFENRDYSGNYMDQACTLSELEDKVGINFFVNLPANVVPMVKETKDQWWYN